MQSIESSKSKYRKYREQRGFFGQKNPAQPAPAGTSPVKGGPAPGAPVPFGHHGHHGPFGPGHMPPDGETSKRRPLKFYLKRYFVDLLQYKGRIAILLSLGLLSLVLNAAGPWTSKFMLDYIFSPTPHEINNLGFLSDIVAHEDKRTLLYGLCGILALVALGEIIFHSISEYVAIVLSATMEVTIRRRLIKHLQVMSLAKIERLKTGGIISRLEGDVSNFSSLLHQGLLAPINGLVMFAIGLGSLMFINPIVTLVCFGFIIALSVVAYFMFNVMRPLFRDLREDASRISGRLAETFGGIRVVRVFGRENRETGEFINAQHLLIRKHLHTRKMDIGIHRMMDILSWGMSLAIWIVGGTIVLDGKITIGDLMVFTQFTRWFFHPVFMIMHNLTAVQNSVACTERVYDMLDEPIDIIDKPDAAPVQCIKEGFQFNNVQFSYESEKPVLKNLSLSIPVGKTVALVGPSGAGKTTITNLLVRFYDPAEGHIMLDGKDISDYQIHDYRSLFALVLQDVFLFDGTISDNIAYSVPGASHEQIVAAAKIAAADEFICEFPDKYDTVIGERGIKLSGGQKQRISLARAILRNPQMLILDEATSSLDSQSEALIQNALRTILKGRTTLVIAHRLSTIMDADKIAVVLDGAIVEEGTHQELLAKGGVYAEMFNKQMNKTAEHFNWNEESAEK